MPGVLERLGAGAEGPRPVTCILCGASGLVEFGPADGYKCPPCSWASEQAEARAALAWRSASALQLALGAGLPRELAEAATGPATSWMPPKLAAWSGKPSWCLLWGPTGTGKTTAAAARAMQLRIELDREVLFLSVPDLAEDLELQRRFQPSRGLMQRALTVDLLVLDEVAASLDDWAEAEDRTRPLVTRLRALLDRRNTAGLATIATTNRHPKWLGEKNMPLASRLCSGLRIEMSGPDRRLRREGA